MTPADAFRLGLADRLAGLPMIARTPDVAELNDAYGAGYDPRDELGLVLPQYAEQVAAFVAECARLVCPEGIPANLPRNACEFGTSQ